MFNTNTKLNAARIVAVVAAVSLLAAACGSDAPQEVVAPASTTTTAAPTATHAADVHVCDSPSAWKEDGFCRVDGQWWEKDATGNWVESNGPPEPLAEEQITEIQQEIAEVAAEASVDDVPPAEIAEQVIEAANEAAPEAELTLGDCTAWVADPEIVLDDRQAAECAAMLAAAIETCEGLDCFPEDGTEPVEEPAPATTVPTEEVPEPSPTTTAPPEEEPTTTTAPPAPTTTTTTTAPPEPEPEVVHIGQWVPPEAGVVPVPVPECEEYNPDVWEGSGCTPQTRWNEGEYDERREDHVFPRQTPTTRAFWDACIGSRPHDLCIMWMGQMKWALDYLGAHPTCVIYQATERVLYYDRTEKVTGSITDRYGWHNCATVIDPLVSEPPDHLSHVGHRLSDTPGITLAERCRIVLPVDIDLWVGIGHDACDGWAASIVVSKSYPNCHQAYILARVWMQHHHGMGLRYKGSEC